MTIAQTATAAPDSAVAQTQAHAPSPRRATIIWLLLIVATVATWTLGEQGAAGPKVAGVLFAIAFLKGRAIALDFMGLKHAPLLWRLLAEGWLVLVCALIGLAYWKGMTP